VIRNKQCFVLVIALSLSFLAVMPARAHAYLGPGTGVEFIPQFMALLAFAGTAVGAILLWPFSRLIRLITGKKLTKNEVKDEGSKDEG
jgi:hypothetical protein